MSTYHDAKAQHCNSRSARATASAPLRIYICYDCSLKHHSHALKAAKQKNNCTAFDTDTGACRIFQPQINRTFRCGALCHGIDSNSTAKLMMHSYMCFIVSILRTWYQSKSWSLEKLIRQDLLCSGTACDCFGETRLVLHVPSSSKKQFYYNYDY